MIVLYLFLLLDRYGDVDIEFFTFFYPRVVALDGLDSYSR